MWTVSWNDLLGHLSFSAPPATAGSKPYARNELQAGGAAAPPGGAADVLPCPQAPGTAHAPTPAPGGARPLRHPATHPEERLHGTGLGHNGHMRSADRAKQWQPADHLGPVHP